MKEIPLGHNKVAIVDDDKYEALKDWKWHLLSAPLSDPKSYQYAACTICLPRQSQVVVLMHQCVIGVVQGKQIDHINHNPLDNRSGNLRHVNQRENNVNSRHQSKTGFLGVYMRPSGRFEAKTMVKGKQRSLGTFDTPQEAYARYLQVSGLSPSFYIHPM